MGSPRIKVALILGGKWGRGRRPSEVTSPFHFRAQGRWVQRWDSPRLSPALRPLGALWPSPRPTRCPCGGKAGPGGAGADQRCLVSQRGRVSLML